MHGFSTVDGFVEITECMAEMIKYVANEPSVGLFYVQQHVQNAVPNVTNIRKNVMERSRETSLNTEDLEDSITMVRSMKECGLPIANEMIKDIRKSLVIMSEKKKKRGSVSRSSSSGFLTRLSSSTEPPPSWSDSEEAIALTDGKKSGYYISTMFKTAKEKASSFKWPQIDLKETIPSFNYPSQFITSSSASSSVVVAEAEDLPLSSKAPEDTAEELQTETKHEQAGTSSLHSLAISVPEDYDVYKADKLAKLEEWLVESGGKRDRLPPSK
ncbi:unnamed protein product [Linum tenue]|uniref:Uncharacterized protein n=1 Tax=Linum tenue TaxID=586396 RepID=A0AAV0MAV1_9ROSI|nr:unnamed protein product [Linum tenue]